MVYVKRLSALLLMICFIFVAGLPVEASKNELEGHDFSWFTGTHAPGKVNSLRTDNLLDGDLIYGWNPGCKYGEWSHVMMVVTVDGDKMIIHAATGGRPNNGIRTINLEFAKENYDVAASERLNVNVSSAQRLAAANKALWFMNNSNGVYDWDCDVGTNDEWQCAKLVYRAYYDAVGINIWHRHSYFAIYPGSVFASPYATLIERTSTENNPEASWEPPEDYNENSMPITITE